MTNTLPPATPTEPFQSSPHSKLKTQNSKLIIILLLFTILTLYNSIVLPIGEAADETDHYQYHRFVARAGRPPLTEVERQEAGFKGGLAPLYYLLTAWPVALVGEDTPPDIRRVDARPERHIPNDGLGINHVLHTWDEQWPWRGQTLAWHLVRFLSLPMGWVTIIAAYALARRLAPEPKLIAVIAAAFVAFLPRFVISSAVINDDNLVLALTALLLLTQVIILQSDQPPSAKIMAVFGALFGLTLITKYFSLILIPEIILTLWVIGRRVTSNRVASSAQYSSLLTSHSSFITNYASRITHYALRTTHYISRFFPPLSSLPPFLIALFLVAGPWFIFIALRFNRIEGLGLIPGLAASLGEPQITEGLVGLLSGHSVRPIAATYPLPEWLSLLYRSFWFEYGWMRLFAPTWIYALFTIFLLLALIGLGLKVLSSGFRVQGSGFGLGGLKQSIRNTQYAIRNTPLPIQLLTLHLLLFAVVLIARYILSATIDTGQGRHLYPALPVIALSIAIGLNHLRFTIYDLRFTIYDLRLSKWPSRLSPIIFYLLLATCFLLPAAVSLLPSFTIQNSKFKIQNSSLITSHYRTIPASSTPILLPIEQRQSLEFDSRLWLVGLDAPGAASAGEALPVTLYWFAETEAQQDYFLSVCLQDEQERPAACWRGHFDDGRYLARAWEQGDTLADTIYIPIPTCYRITEQAYTLHLQIWPLDPTSPAPVLPETPLLNHVFTEPKITIRPTDSLQTLPQTVDIWLNKQRPIQPAEIQLNQSLAYIAYQANQSKPFTTPKLTTSNGDIWQSLPQFDTPLYLPCADGPAPFAQLSHFIAGPTRKNGNYQLSINNYQLTNPPITLALRDRTLAPITATLAFSQTLAPLSLQLPNYPTLDFTQSPIINYQLSITNYQLPITIHWQARRWMAEPLVVALKLLDKDFAVGGERVALLGDRYPNVLWAPTEIVEETYPIQIKADTPPGLYTLELSLLRQDGALPGGFEYLPLAPNANHLYPLTIRLLDPAHNTKPDHPLQATLGESIHLTGYTLTDQNNQPIQNPKLETQNSKLKTQNLKLILFWQSTAKISQNYTVFTQLIGPDGQVWAQWDNPPQAGRYPTTAWSHNDKVIDRYTLTLKEGAPTGGYRLLVGMYNSSTGERLPVAINGTHQPDNAVELTTLPIVP
jgi:hypothetical protein